MINPKTYGTCEKIAPMLRRGLRYVEGAVNGHILHAGLQKGPNTILIATSFHELEAAPKAG
jgi:hypothetical protein